MLIFFLSRQAKMLCLYLRKFLFIVRIAMYHYDVHVKVAYDNFGNKRIMMMMVTYKKLRLLGDFSQIPTGAFPPRFIGGLSTFCEICRHMSYLMDVQNRPALCLRSYVQRSRFFRHIRRNSWAIGRDRTWNIKKRIKQMRRGFIASRIGRPLSRWPHHRPAHWPVDWPATSMDR